MEIWEIASILGHNDAPAEDAQSRVPEGPNAFNVRRMMAEAKAREEGREVTDNDRPSQAEVLDLIRRGKAG